MRKSEKVAIHASVAALMAILAANCIGCRVSHENTPCSATPSSAATTGCLSQEVLPRLDTNAVLRLSHAAAKERRYRIDDYVCDAVWFEHSKPPARWVLHFVSRHPTPDSDFFVTIIDATGQAAVRRW
jgi:hypothetical protein